MYDSQLQQAEGSKGDPDAKEYRKNRDNESISFLKMGEECFLLYNRKIKYWGDEEENT